jgi:type IV secretion system protein VirB9
MTIITNLRTYQFEIQSKSLSQSSDEELVYVARFFYPDEAEDNIIPEVEDLSVLADIPVTKPYNYNYTLEGPDDISPLEIFDDGINTYFKFSRDVLANIIGIKSTADGENSNLTMRYKGEYIYVNAVSRGFIISSKDAEVSIFNEGYAR